MMSTLIDLCFQIGRATWSPLWVPVLGWTSLALPLWLLLRRTDRLHPHAEYRLSQGLLVTLPLSLLASGSVDLFGGAPMIGGSSAFSFTVLPPLDATAQGASPRPSWSRFHTLGLFTVGAGGAALFRLGRLVLDVTAARRLRRPAAGECPETVQSVAQNEIQRLGVSRPVQIRVSDAIRIPATLGGLRPTILLPSSLTDQPEGLRMSLAHELVHVRRYDDVATLLERFLAAVFAVHPLVEWIRRHADVARERACDAAVLAEAGVGKADYARLLTAFASGDSFLSLRSLFLAQSPSSLTHRLHAMRSTLSQWLSTPIRLFASLILIGGLVTFGVVACTDQIGALSSDDSSSTETERSSTVSMTDVDDPPQLEGGMDALRDAIQYPALAEKAGIEGKVFISFVVDETGRPQHVQVEDGVHESLDSAAVHAVRSVSFDPARKEGQPVAVQMTLPVRFQLPSSESGTSSATEEATVGARLDERLQIEGGMAALREHLFYPEIVRRAGIEGTVHITATVAADGTVQDARVTKSVHEDLDAATRTAIEQVTFVSDDRNPQEITIPITFRRPQEPTDA